MRCGKQQVKLALVQDYVDLTKVATLCAFCRGQTLFASCWSTCWRLQSRCERLQGTYQNLLMQVGANDLAFTRLQNELHYDWAKFFHLYRHDAPLLATKLQTLAHTVDGIEHALPTKLQQLTKLGKNL